MLDIRTIVYEIKKIVNLDRPDLTAIKIPGAYGHCHHEHQSRRITKSRATNAGLQDIIMNKVHYLTEMGMGVDVHGGDYTKAACRAVSDALRHSSLNFFKPLKKSHNDMHITVKIGVAKPHMVDCEAIAKQVPYGTVTVEAGVGGLNIEADDESDELVIANAGILVHFEE